MPRPKSARERIQRWILMPIALLLLLVKQDKLALVAFLFGCASLIHFAEEEVRWSRDKVTIVPESR